MKRTLRFKEIRWGDKFETYADERPFYPGVDGAAVYEITLERTEQELAEAKANEIVYLNPYTFTVHQPFKNTGLTVIDNRNVWAWDGNREAPTLTPSWLMDRGPGDVRIHLYLTGGKINLLGDSNVELVQ